MLRIAGMQKTKLMAPVGQNVNLTWTCKAVQWQYSPNPKLYKYGVVVWITSMVSSVLLSFPALLNTSLE